MPERCRLARIAMTLWVVPAVAVAGKIDPADPPKGTFMDDWMIVRLAGVDTGWAHSTISRNADGIETELTMHLVIQRAGQKIEIRMSEGTTETVAGAPLAFGSTMKLATMETKMTGRIENGKVVLSSSQFGNKTEQTFDFPAGAKMSWGAYAEQLRRGLAPGTEYDLPTYAPSVRADGAINTHVVVRQKEKIDVGGRSMECVRVAQTIEAPMGRLDSTVWMNADGDAVKMEMPFPGIGVLEMILADEAAAKAAAGEGAEVFVNTLIRVDRPIDRANARAIRYRLTLTGQDDQPPPGIPATAMQTPGPWQGKSMELRVARIDRAAPRNAPATQPSGVLEEYRSANLWINNDDAEIVKMARQAAGDEKNVYAICDRLRRHVTDVIREKNLGVGFATASEVARRREGDCSEHAVLLAALGRAMGIPSRVVYGVVYVPAFQGTDNVFGFHMWTQFLLDGQWVDFDAAQRESDCNPTHIAFATSSMKDASMGDFAFPLIRLLGQIRLEVLDVEPPPGSASRPASQ